MAGDDEIVQRAIAKFGPVLDLQERPQDLIDILRASRLEGAEHSDAGLPGGVPQPPPGPSSMQGSAANLDDVMSEVLKLQRRLTKTAKDVKLIRGHLNLDS